MLEQLTRALLYEGYALFPYKRTATKNMKPVPFGVVYPQHYNVHHPEAHSHLQTECIVKGNADVELEIKVRFLHLRINNLLERTEDGVVDEKDENGFHAVASLKSGDENYVSGWEAIEREVVSGNVAIAKLVQHGRECRIEFPEVRESRLLYNPAGEVAGKQISELSSLIGLVTILARPVAELENFFKITVKVSNTTRVKNPDTVSRDEIFQQSFLSTHTILRASGGEFISVLAPEEQWQAVVAQCQNINTWPVLVDQDNSTMLSSPIIIYDHPQMAPQSTGDLFDSTEIEEALLLHVAVLSDEEKKTIANTDEKLRAMLEKAAQVTPQEIMNLHGILREV